MENQLTEISGPKLVLNNPVAGSDSAFGALDTAGDDQKVGVGMTKTVVSGLDKVGRNDTCPCGSGKKYKKCHGA